MTKKVFLSLASLATVAVLISMSPDIKRYIKMERM